MENKLWTEHRLIPDTYLFDMFIFLVTRLQDHKLNWKLLCVTLSWRPWLNKLIISYAILPLSHNDIPCECEHVSVPAKHLPLLCCPAAPPSLCRRAHCLMDETDRRVRETAGPHRSAREWTKVTNMEGHHGHDIGNSKITVLKCTKSCFILSLEG